MAPRARVSGLPEANGQKTTLRAAGPRTHVTSIVNGFTRPDAAAFGPLGNIGNAASQPSKVSRVRPKGGLIAQRPGTQRSAAPVWEPSGPDLVQSATWIDHS
jgi:hypothetical protein